MIGWNFNEIWTILRWEIIEKWKFLIQQDSSQQSQKIFS